MPCSDAPDHSLLLKSTADGIRLVVRLTPKAGANAIRSRALEADGTPVLKVSVTAVPENGKANTALIALLAKAWKLPKSTFSIVSGTTDRRKTVQISGDPAILIPHITGILPP
ncbi:DUF167 family protein [Haematospirillum sp. H1815]|uniref:DUF167 family protein n=1 Tax=Haematospirillum sp. H1815 TaxID=2723108 RepID=UPI002AC36A47|nr:DUF167 family protein [Haematospirillum sp. H1815]